MEPAQYQSPQPLPYQEVTTPDYARVAALDFRAGKPMAGVVELKGICPRCRAVMVVTLIDSGFKTALPQQAGAGRPDAETGRRIEPIICTCAEDHPNRPEDRFGCGAYWTFELR